jgi:hypothetical protein
MSTNKKIAVLSPVAWRTPPRQYGAWETVASNITEGLVARGWDVTLFATGDSITRARLHSVVDRGYEEDHSVDPKVAEYLHIAEAFEHAAEFDLIHSHYDFMALGYTRLVETPVLTTSTASPHHRSCRSMKSIVPAISFPSATRIAHLRCITWRRFTTELISLSTPTNTPRRGSPLYWTYSSRQGRSSGHRSGEAEWAAIADRRHRAG